MIYTWEIFVEGKSQGTLESMTELGAVEQFYMKFGGPSRYTGLTINNIVAVRV